jgi:methylated-DNA-[protein]-cysteine S-methyltransferase
VELTFSWNGDTMNDHTQTIPGRCTAQLRIASPLGPLLLARTRDGLAGAWFENQKHHPAPIAAPERDDDALLCRAARELEAYFDGDEAGFDVPLDLHGTPFQRAVWGELLKLERGATCSYGDIARRLGRPTAGRAVGAAVGRNPVSIIVPCHRVVGSTGSLTGYAGGLERKTALLRIESARPRREATRPALGPIH